MSLGGYTDVLRDVGGTGLERAEDTDDHRDRALQEQGDLPASEKERPEVMLWEEFLTEPIAQDPAFVPVFAWRD